VIAPFPWFGGKSRVASVVWRAFGDVPNYIEPFAGSLAVLLGRPHPAGTETVNDRDAYVSNFWRALAAVPDEVARWADWPVNEADLHARHRWLIGQSEFRARMLGEPAFFDAKIAGWWAWGLCAWIGTGWCAGAYGQRGEGAPSQQLPHLGDAGKGERLAAYLSALSGRLREVRVACGDWTRVLGDSVTFRHGTTGVLLDPPYPDTEAGYAVDDGDVWADAARWAEANGGHHDLRIALCGYEGLPAPAWTCLPWKANGGYGSQGDGDGRDNAHRERIWFSPHCLPIEPVQRRLFADG
jgi:DNA adenine methylase